MKKDEFMKTFMNQYLGRAIDFDGAYGAQCVDGAKIGIGLLGCTSFPAIGDAIAYWTNTSAHPWLSANTVRITDINELNVGDLVICSTPSPTGHIAWYAGDGKIFGQNQDGNRDAFSIRNLSGWTFAGALRFKGFDDFSEPVHTFNGGDTTNEYEATNFMTSFTNAFASAFGTAFAEAMKKTRWRNNQSGKVYFPYEEGGN